MLLPLELGEEGQSNVSSNGIQTQRMGEQTLRGARQSFTAGVCCHAKLNRLDRLPVIDLKNR